MADFGLGRMIAVARYHFVMRRVVDNAVTKIATTVVNAIVRHRLRSRRR
jgi:hypothetical protein